MASLSLRPAEADDCLLVWQLRNDAAARAASNNAEPIPFEVHQRWWQTRLGDPSSVIYIVSPPGGPPAGYVRFAVEDSEAEISIALEAGARGRGYGSAAIRLGSEALLNEGHARRIVALVKPDNETSLRAFRQAGFLERGRSAASDAEMIELVLEAA